RSFFGPEQGREVAEKLRKRAGCKRDGEVTAVCGDQVRPVGRHGDARKAAVRGTELEGNDRFIQGRPGLDRRGKSGFVGLNLAEGRFGNAGSPVFGLPGEEAGHEVFNPWLGLAGKRVLGHGRFSCLRRLLVIQQGNAPTVETCAWKAKSKERTAKS